MSCSGIEFTNVYITGPFTGWCGDCFLLEDADGDGIFTGTFDFPAGDIEYKYEVDNWAYQEDLIDDMLAGSDCAPVTDYANFANRLVSAGSTTNDTYGQCTECVEGEVPGCTDETATNYDADANVDNGSCIFPTTFNVDMSCSGLEFTNVYITGPFTGWCGDCYLLTDEDGDGIYSGTFDFAGDVEYKYEVDNWIHQEDLVDDMNAGADCAPVTDFANYANRLVSAGSTTNDTYGSCSECTDEILGCTDPNAWNYNELANTDDGTCDYCEPVTVNFSVDAGDVVSADYDNVVINGSFAGPRMGCSTI